MMKSTLDDEDPSFDPRGDAEDQEDPVLSEADARLTTRDEIPSYGSVEDRLVEDRLVEDADEPSGSAGFVSILYGWVLTLVGLSYFVAVLGNVRHAPKSVPIESDDRFPFASTTEHPLQPGPLWGFVRPPYPTGAWWVNVALEDGNYPVVPLPYTFRATENGVGVSYSAIRRVVSLGRVQDIYAADLDISAVGTIRGHHVLMYDNLTVTIEHDVVGGGRFKTLAARGSPYMTFEFEGTIPMIRCGGGIREANGVKPRLDSSLKGDFLRLTLGNGEVWLVFTSESVNWIVKAEDEIQMGKLFSGIVRVATLPSAWDADSEDVLKRYAYAYPRGGKVTVAVQGDQMIIRYEWEKSGFGDLLMMALPHHMDTLETDGSDGVVVTMEGSYQTIKGPMSGILGTVWCMRDNLTEIAWTAKAPLREAALSITDPPLAQSWEGRVRRALARDVNVLPTSSGVYGFGKELARTARLALIADELGDYASRERALVILDTSLTPWMKNDNRDLLIYDTSWGGVVTNNGLNDQSADFGNAWYNDHIYHYGYILYAAAVLIKFRPAFYKEFKHQLTFLVGDIAGTERIRALFPTARQKDFYDWHSWTSGLFPQADGKSQESVSESINAYYAVYLLGHAVGDDYLRDWGKALLAMELRAARKYWQMPRENGVYDSFFSSDRMVGIVASLEAVKQTWFGDQVEFVHCINMIPFTPITEELLLYDFMEQEWPVLATAFDGRDSGPQWSGYVSLAGAVVLAHESWLNVSTLEVFDSGNSLTNSLYWIATRPQRAFGAYDESNFTVEVKVEPQCKANSACYARGLAGEEMCCPTADGDWLGCCPSYSTSNDQSTAACSANLGCVALGLEAGMCCPTLDGKSLTCCQQGGPAAKDIAADPNALCSANGGCASLQGSCCPTDEGTYLPCCDALESERRISRGDDRACARHPDCAGLKGDCCPTPEDTYLTCCSPGEN